MFRRLVAFVSVLCCVFLSLNAVAMDKIPGRTNFLVNDYAHVLSNENKEYLEKKLEKLRGTDFIGTEVVVSTFKTLGSTPFDAFMSEYAKNWRRPILFENDNRVHLIIVVDDRKVRMGVGKYLEKVITTDRIKELISNVMFPDFSKGDFNNGIKNGVDSLILVIEKESPKSYGFRNFRVFFRLLLLILLIAILVLFVKLKKGRKAGANS